MTSLRVLTGITTTGTPHLGNYVGAIRRPRGASMNVATMTPAGTNPFAPRAVLALVLFGLAI